MSARACMSVCVCFFSFVFEGMQNGGGAQEYVVLVYLYLTSVVHDVDAKVVERTLQGRLL